MIIDSVTVSISKAVHDDWLNWMQAHHIPDVMATGFFKSHQIFRLLDPIQDALSVTYSIQYWCESMKEYETYQKDAAPALQADHTERFKDQFVAFRTLLETV